MSWLNLDIEPKSKIKNLAPQASQDVKMAPFVDIDTPKTEKSGLNVPQITSEVEKATWDYPELQNCSVFNIFSNKKIYEVEHVTPTILKSQILKNRDVACWVETVWMCMKLNVRYSIFEAMIPEHLRECLGGNLVRIYIDLDKTDKLVWSINNVATF